MLRSNLQMLGGKRELTLLARTKVPIIKASKGVICLTMVSIPYNKHKNLDVIIADIAEQN